MSALVRVRGELFVTLEGAAECYELEASWVHELHRRGLLAEGERIGESLAFPAAELDRLAAILRWHRHLGLDLDAVRLFLD